MNEHISNIMIEENLTRAEATCFFEEMKGDCAGFHLFLAEIYNKYIDPKI
jgi:hypothetical protein